MGFIEANIIPILNTSCVTFYIDDCFVLAQNEEVVDALFTVLNEVHHAIKFIVEKEINNELSFMDVLVKCQNNRFLTSVFRKNTFTGNYLNF